MTLEEVKTRHEDEEEIGKQLEQLDQEEQLTAELEPGGTRELVIRRHLYQHRPKTSVLDIIVLLVLLASAGVLTWWAYRHRLEIMRVAVATQEAAA